MKKCVAMLMMVLTLSLASTAGAAINTVHDLNTDMDGTVAQAGNWAYGYSVNLGDFGLDDTLADGGSFRLWYNSGQAVGGSGSPHLWYCVSGTFFGSDAGEHGFCPPIDLQEADYTTFRWTAPADVASAVDITGWVRPADTAQAKEVFVAKNGTPLLSAVVTDTLVDFTGMSNVTIATGDVIDFAIHNYDGSAGSDWCGISAAITEVPEPLTIGLLSLGGLALLRRRR